MRGRSGRVRRHGVSRRLPFVAVLAHLNGIRPENRPTPRWKPIPAVVHLKKGVNTLLVKNHGGSMFNLFVCYIADPGDLKIAPTPAVQK